MPTLHLFFRALKYTVLTFATTHLVISYSLMLVRDVSEGNLFRIIAFNHLWPGIDIGTRSFIISQIIGVSLFCVYFGYLLIKDRKTAAKTDA